MVASSYTPTSKVDLDYVAVCIAEQIVRIKIAAAHGASASDRAYQTSALLARPLATLAMGLGIKERVDRLVADALPGAF